MNGSTLRSAWMIRTHRAFVPAAAIVCLLLATAIASFAGGAPPGTVGADPDLDRLWQWLSGSFSSAEQAKADSAYFDIRLHVAPIWKERADARWLYVEQARSDVPERPYRQRVYRLTRVAPNLYESGVYTLRSPLRFAGVWKEESPLSGLTPDSLTAREGCSIFLRAMKDGSFAGSTLGTDCASDLRGALYATSAVRITAESMTSWDRGFDAEGKQAWGAEKGPYLFRRASD
jgi:hypothetical protein